MTQSQQCRQKYS